MEAWREELYSDKNELYHFGIIGQKWGIRRYQNYDGTYTKRGLERYNKSYEQYQNSKDFAKMLKRNTGKPISIKDPKTGKDTDVIISKNAAKEYNQLVKQNKKELIKNYKQLKQDKLADEGKELYKQGKRIRENEARNQLLITATGLASAAATMKYYNSGESYYSKVLKTDIPLEYLAPAVVTAGGMAVTAMLNIKPEMENRRLRAYYGR